MTEKKRKFEPIGPLVGAFLEQSGLAPRVAQAAVVPEWPRLVGPQIAAATEPLSVTPDGTLFVAVRTHAWMNELSLLEPELLQSLNSTTARAPIRRIRWRLLG